MKKEHNTESKPSTEFKPGTIRMEECGTPFVVCMQKCVVKYIVTNFEVRFAPLYFMSFCVSERSDKEDTWTWEEKSNQGFEKITQ
jgi:hypothetical protein